MILKVLIGSKFIDENARQRISVTSCTQQKLYTILFEGEKERKLTIFLLLYKTCVFRLLAKIRF